MNWEHTWISYKGAQLDRGVCAGVWEWWVQLICCSSVVLSLYKSNYNSVLQNVRVLDHKLFNICQSRFLDPHTWNKAFATITSERVWLAPGLSLLFLCRQKFVLTCHIKKYTCVTWNPDFLKVNKGVKIVVWVAAVATRISLKNHYENTEHREVWKCLCENKCLLPIKR